MNWLHYHPDGMVYIRDVNDAPIYSASVAEFAADYGAPFPLLPAGMAQLELYDGRVYMYDAKHNERDAHRVNPAPYQAVLDAMPLLLEARKTRLARLPEGTGTIPVHRP